MFRLSAVLVFYVSITSALPSQIPVGSPVSDRLFMVARELYGRGLLDQFEYSELGGTDSSGISDFPGDLFGDYVSLRNDYSYQGQTPRLSASLGIIESNRQKTHNSNFLKLFPLVRMDFSRRVSATVLYRIDGELTRDARYDGNSWNGVAGFAENATIDYNAGDFGLRFGIERLSWGLGGYGNLMFDRQAMPMAIVGLKYRRWIFDFETMLGFLNPLKNELDRMETDTSYFTSQQRYLSSHSLSVRPWRGLSLSFRETVVYGGPGRRFEPAYVFPMIWYHGEQLNSRIDDNTLSSVAADFRLAGRFWIYGELLIDDFQIEKESRGDNEPNELAFLAGCEAYDLIFNKSTVAIEYARADNRTYNQARPHNRYMNDNFPIGFPLGPDADILDWRLSWWANRRVRLSYVGSFRRHGEGRIDAPWTFPWLGVDNYAEPFPTGIVERGTINGLSLLALNKNWLWGNMEVNYADIKNVGNMPGKSEKSWEFAIDIGMRLPPFSWGF